MLFHEPDRTYKRLAGCWKRAKAMAEQGEIPLSHPLSIAWLNTKMMIEHSDGGTDDLCFDINCLDWFAMILDEYSKDHFLIDDKVVSAILYEWMETMFFDPTKLTGKRSIH